jgi:light-regulated signal transduction histidine kinase (bacteriophytochrome)
VTAASPIISCLEVNRQHCAELDIGELTAVVEKCVQRRTATLEAANRGLEAFVASVVHELRAPLRAINGFNELLLQHSENQMGPDAKPHLMCIAAAGRRMSEVIDALLILCKAEHASLRCEEIDLRRLLLQIVDDLQAQETHRSIDVTIEQVPRIYGDHVLIRQAFENLLSNAFKYTRGRTVAKIQVGYFVENEQTIFFVRDNGSGFDAQYADRLFSPFQRLHRAEEFEGTGIGLALVRRIIDRHAGRVWAESARDMGTTLYVAIPQDRRRSSVERIDVR